MTEPDPPAARLDGPAHHECCPCHLQWQQMYPDPHCTCKNHEADLAALRQERENLKAASEQLSTMVMRLLRIFEPAVSSRIPDIVEVEDKAAELLAVGQERDRLHEELVEARQLLSHYIKKL